MPSVLITGASRGIGLGLARVYAARGWRVFATCRDPDRAAALRELAGAGVTRHRLDVADHGRIDALAAELAGEPIDVLLNNAGIGARDAAFGRFDYDRFRDVLATNLFGPTRMAEAFLPHVMAGQQRKIVAVSSSLGSISTARGGNAFYATSKAALNMMYRSFARELARQGVIVALFSPGVVDTDFTAGTTMPKVPVETSAEGLVALIDRLTLDEAGAFIRYNGDVVPW